MCLAIPGEIVSVKAAWAEVEVMGIISRVNIQLIEEPEVGDHILIHAGCAIQRISTGESMYLQSILMELAAWEDSDG